MTSPEPPRLVRRQLLSASRATHPELTVKRTSSGEVLSFRPDDAERLLPAAAAPPRRNVRSAWPALAIAVVATLAHCGLRVSQLIGLTIAGVGRHSQLTSFGQVAPIARETVSTQARVSVKV